ncbi:hypothetical protein KGF54_005497 [Candida jiufengensis]|uniref:uncharacterized protein n=1 Tax=Candida jiufengensis TaxID=497108 RepID=UPI0022244272|nr:uncharacterized protein KGF54_005497 [Candida jiufengensis]KAI5949619.1 hypothetical protein KGF54_005497 [Candida jiufengensis]
MYDNIKKQRSISQLHYNDTISTITNQPNNASVSIPDILSNLKSNFEHFKNLELPSPYQINFQHQQLPPKDQIDGLSNHINYQIEFYILFKKYNELVNGINETNYEFNKTKLKNEQLINQLIVALNGDLSLLSNVNCNSSVDEENSSSDFLVDNFLNHYTTSTPRFNKNFEADITSLGTNSEIRDNEVAAKLENIFNPKEEFESTIGSFD